MKKIYAFLLLAAIAGFTLASCSKTEPDTPTTPTTQPSEPKEPTVVKHTIPFKITVALPTDTKVTLEDETNFEYDFSSGDQILVSADGVTGSLAYTSGKEFNGSITYEDGKLVSGSTVLNLTLVSAGKGSAMTSADYSSAVSTVSITDAIQKYSNFTGSLTYSNTPGNIKLTQISAFLKFSLTLDGYPDGEYTVKVIDDSHGAGSPFVGGNVSVSSSTVVFYVALLTDAGTGKVTLSNAKLQITGGPNNISKTLPFGSASQDIHKNMCYPVTRTIDDTFTIRAREDNTKITFNYSDESGDIQYKIDGKGSWVNYTAEKKTAGILLAADHYVSFKSKKKTYGSLLFSSVNSENGSENKNVYIYGNIMSLIGDGTNYGPIASFPKEGKSSTGYENAFKQAFENATWIDIPDDGRLLLPSTYMVQNCYQGMFRNSSIIKGPEINITHTGYLNSTVDSAASCREMFSGCTNLTTVYGSITAELGTGCFYQMFKNCEKLEGIPNFTINVVGQECCREMFLNCKSLSSFPIVLNQTSLATRCFFGMFNGCEEMTSSPVSLTVNTLVDDCYKQMFYGCKKLTTAPELPATTLVTACYEQMFQGCSALNSVKCLATSGFGEKNCLNNWLNGVSSSGTFYRPAAADASWATGGSGIPSGWTRTDI